MAEQASIHAPFGFNQGDPLIICRSNLNDDIRESSNRLHIKGYYCGPFSVIGGRRHNQIIIDIHAIRMTTEQYSRYWRWITESIMTKLPPGGGQGVFFV